MPSQVETLIREGRFRSALELLRKQLRSRQPHKHGVLDACEAELLFETGQVQTAIRRAQDGIRVAAQGPTTVSLHRVLALAYFAEGDRQAAEYHLREAFRHSEPRSVICAQLHLIRFNLALAFESLETALAELPQVRRAVIATGDAHLLILLHLLVARAELRSRGISEAMRHHRTALRLLDRFPNLWLRGLLMVDRSVGWTIVGDLDSALDAAEAALRVAEESGHLHTRLAAEVNISHILERRGDFGAARRYIGRVFEAVGSDRHIARAARDSLANVLISAGEVEQAEALLERSAQLAVEEHDVRPHWDAIGEHYSRARLAMARDHWPEAVRQLTRGLSVAVECGDLGWARRILLARSRSCAVMGDLGAALDDLRRSDDTDPDPALVAEQHAAMAALAWRAQMREESDYHATAADRIATTAANMSLRNDLARATGALGLTVSAMRPELAILSLGSAVTLLETAAHPHILGREVCELLDATACTERYALVVRGPGRRRTLLSSGGNRPAIDDERAYREVLALGTREDEYWEVFATPCAGLQPYIAFTWIRKLVRAAVALEAARQEEKARVALWPADGPDTDTEYVSASDQMHEVLKVARRIARSPIAVLITGETGTGKEMLSRAIHRYSDRADRPFLPFNCSAVPREMLASQLFGYRKGAFTGADSAFGGIIRAASGGTLFLDEIGDVGLDVQPKLLRFLESHEVHPLGEPHPIPVDVRIVAATNAPLEELVAQGRFRGDLFYRLNGITLHVPPLRERREEIPHLVQFYLRREAREQGKGALAVSDETLEYLLLYRWPGNVRQLANEVRRLVALAEPDSVIAPALLSPELQASRRTIPADAPPATEEARIPLDLPLPAAVERLERLLIDRALERTGGRVEPAARLLGLSRKGLFLKRRRWGITSS